MLDEAIAAACKSGDADAATACSRRSSRRARRTSILGQPIHFDTKGDLIGAKWFLFKINQQGKYTLVTNS